MVKFPSSSLSLFFSLQPLCLQCIQTIPSALNPQRKIQWVILQQRKTSFSTSLSSLSCFIDASSTESSLCVSITDCYCYPMSYIQHSLNSSVPHVEVFYQTAWQPGEFPPGFPDLWQSNVVTNLIKSPTHLNPIMQISVCKAVKSLSGNVNVVRIVPDDWNLDLWIFCFLLYLVNRDPAQCWLI